MKSGFRIFDTHTRARWRGTAAAGARREELPRNMDLDGVD